MSVLKTIYEHDCDWCVYLGPHREGEAVYDLYHCMQTGSYMVPTVIARYSSDGPDYTSGMIFADRELIPALVEAKRRAVLLGLPVGGQSSP